jgi:hypothetical protein
MKRSTISYSLYSKIVKAFSTGIEYFKIGSEKCRPIESAALKIPNFGKIVYFDCIAKWSVSLKSSTAKVKNLKWNFV